MRGMLAVYHKELLSYFRSPIAYFVVAVFLIGTGYFFLYNVLVLGSAVMDETLQNMGILLITLIPLVSMRLFSSEYSGRTMELLATLPLKAWQVVVGKYLGALTILLIMTLASMVNLIPLYMYSTPLTLNLMSGYLGFFLLGMACLAIGQFCSALTQNQIVAALITIAVLLAFWFIGHLEQFQPNARAFIRYVAFQPHFADFIRGLIRSEAVAFYAIVVAIALTLNASYLQWRR
jgi:ABC-2 type transport system permease protein